jgi:hypothetical protein
MGIFPRAEDRYPRCGELACGQFENGVMHKEDCPLFDPWNHRGYWSGYFNGYIAGAAVLDGLKGMAEAIRARCTCPPDVVHPDGTRTMCHWSEVCERCKGYP